MSFLSLEMQRFLREYRWLRDHNYPLNVLASARRRCVELHEAERLCSQWFRISDAAFALWFAAVPEALQGSCLRTPEHTPLMATYWSDYLRVYEQYDQAHEALWAARNALYDEGGDEQ